MSWVAVARVDECKSGKAVIVNVDGKEIGLFNEGGKYFAVLNHCPHRGAPICRGRVEGRVLCLDDETLTYDAEAKTLRCPWHHWEFDLESGHPVAAIRERLKVFPVRTEDDTVYVKV